MGLENDSKPLIGICLPAACLAGIQEADSAQAGKSWAMGNEIIKSREYRDWLIDIKRRVRSAQLKAATAVNTALLEFYWSLGADIAEKQKNTTWGSGFLKQLSKDLMVEFSNMKGFSYRNLRAIKQWYLFYSQDNTIWQQAVAKMGRLTVTEKWQQPVAILTRIPWGHNLAIISKCDSVEQAFFYVRKTIAQIEAELQQSDEVSDGE